MVQKPPNIPGKTLTAWLPILVGLLVLYLPTFIDLFNGIWKTDENGHGPMILLIVSWYFVFRIKQVIQDRSAVVRAAPGVAAVWLGIGLLSYAIGRSQGVLVLEVGSIIPVIAACTAMVLGTKNLKQMWFAFFFMLFVIPLPASLADAMTQPMKIAVSYATEHILHWFNYPIARNGVVLIIGQYQLLVADACAGLHSLYTLEALGLLYMNIVRHQSVLRNAVLATLIVPISFTANTMRVIALALITYHYGDAAGQGFVHGFAGMLLFVFALLLIFGVDSLIGTLVKSCLWRHIENKMTHHKNDMPMPHVEAGGQSNDDAIERDHGIPKPCLALRIKLRAAIAITMAMLLTAATAYALTPNIDSIKSMPNLVNVVPKDFGDWHEVPSPLMQIGVTPEGKDSLVGQLYDDVLMRTYVNSRGEQVMLALAYARQQKQDIKIHRPEVCYPAQGFEIINQAPAEFNLGRSYNPVHGQHLLTRNGNRTEAVSYWIRIGNQFPDNGWQARWYILREGMSGRVPDGILVRASSSQDAERGVEVAYQLQEAFLRDLVDALPPEAARLFVARDRAMQ